MWQWGTLAVSRSRSGRVTEDGASLGTLQVANVEGWMVSVLCSFWVQS